jgi:hypothetical protein
MLIDFIGRPTQPHSESPIVGSLTDNIPTSGDVHLYVHPNPKTDEGKQFPMLYADSEGFEGGEIPPLSTQLTADPNTSEGKSQRGVRDIQWRNSPEKCRREFAVTQLYPRLLYTFSDVVVFVLRNARYMTGQDRPSPF